MSRMLVVSLGLLLLGCASADPRNYTLEPVAGTPRHSPKSTVVVRGVQVPRYMERNEIVRAVDNGRLHIASDDWWAEPLRAMLQRVLAADLAQRLPDADVLSTTSIASNGREVALALDRFEPDGMGVVILIGHASIEENGRPRLLRRFDIHVPGGRSAREQVQAMGLALGQLADALAETLNLP